MGSLVRAMLASTALQGCAIDALVGENPDVPTLRDVAPVIDAAVIDAPVIDAPVIDAAVLDRPDIVDLPPTDLLTAPEVRPEDARRLGDDVTTAMVGIDATLDAATDAATDARGIAAETATAVDAASDDIAVAEDVPLLLPDAGLGAPCRRDLECARDPAGPFCSMLHQRCAAMR